MTKSVDGLTGLPNGHALHLFLDEAIAAKGGVALGVVDVDQFHAYNKTAGHEAGDELLKRIAALLTEGLPGQVYRVSGDEFACAFPGLSLEQAFLRMEAVRAAVEAANLPGGVTITVGVAHAPRNAKDYETLRQTADAALVAAKEAGRNQVALPPAEEMVMKSCYYPSSAVRRLKTLAERLGRKESELLREGLSDLLRKYDQ